MSKEEREQLNRAIKKLRQAYHLGQKVIEKLDAGGRTQYRQVGYGEAARKVCEELGVSFSESTARNYVAFVRRFSRPQLNALIRNCRQYGHAPSFDVVVRLLAVRDIAERDRLVFQVLANQWSKIRLGQEMRRVNATSSFVERDPDSQLEKRNRGRPPKAISNLEALLGELHDDAVKWRRIHTELVKRREAKDTKNFGEEAPAQLMMDIKKLADVFQGFFDWELSDK